MEIPTKSDPDLASQGVSLRSLSTVSSNRVDGHPEIAEVRKEPEQRSNIGGRWHTDHSYDIVPTMGSSSSLHRARARPDVPCRMVQRVLSRKAITRARQAIRR